MSPLLPAHGPAVRADRALGALEIPVGIRFPSLGTRLRLGQGRFPGIPCEIDKTVRTADPGLRATFARQERRIGRPGDCRVSARPRTVRPRGHPTITRATDSTFLSGEGRSETRVGR